MRRLVADLRALSRTTRLSTEKLVKARKESIRTEIYQEGVAAYRAHIDGLNKRIGKPYMPTLPVDFAGCIKGKKTVASLRDAVAGHLANAKIAANDVADKISVNLATLVELASEHKALFPDTGTIVLKAPDDLIALVKTRIADHERAEAERLEAQRAAIVEQERVKAEKKAREELAEQQRREAEQAVQAAAVATVVATAPAKAPEPVLVQACRPEDRAMLQTGAGKELVKAAHAVLDQTRQADPSDGEVIAIAVQAVSNYFGLTPDDALSRLAEIQEWLPVTA